MEPSTYKDALRCRKILARHRLIRDRLNWLPMPQRIQFKLCMMMYKAMHGLAPAYLSELCVSFCVEGRTRLSARGDLVVQRARTKFGGRAFVVAGPAAWNRLHGQFQDGSEEITVKY